MLAVGRKKCICFFEFEMIDKAFVVFILLFKTVLVLDRFCISVCLFCILLIYCHSIVSILCFIDLYPVAKIIIQNNNTKTSQNRTNNSVLNGGNANLSSLVILAGKCLQVKIFIFYFIINSVIKVVLIIFS